MMRSSLFLLGSAGVLVILSTPSHSLSLADQELIHQQERERVLQEQRQAPAPDIRLTRPLAALDDYPADETPCFTIRDIRLEGEAAARFQGILSAVSKAQGRCLGVQGVNLVMKQAQNELIRRGYVTTRVLVPPQDLSRGELVLTLYPGRIQQVRFVESTSVRANWQNALPAKPGDILNLRDIEQALENFKRVPTVEADIQIEPASQDGYSDLVISWKEGRPIRLSLSADDGGSKSTGRYQSAVMLSLDNVFTLNDLFYINLGKDLPGNSAFGSRSRSMSYSIPFGYWMLGGSYSYYRYYQTIVGINEDYRYHGDSINTQFYLSRLIYRDDRHKTTLSLRSYLRKSRNFIEDTEIELQRRQTAGWELALSQRSYWGGGAIDGGLTWRRGTGAFGALTAPEERLDQGRSRPSIVLADASLNLPFKLGGKDASYNVAWRGQWSKAPLVPQDRFSIGGRYSVRGFDGETSLSGDRGWSLRQDLAWQALGFGPSFYLGVDYGRVSGPATENLTGQSLSGGVVGLRGSLFKQLSYDIFAGKPFSQPANFAAAKRVAGFNLNWQY